jgi:transcriptional regulator with XRE-family HTH domain
MRFLSYTANNENMKSNKFLKTLKRIGTALKTLRIERGYRTLKDFSTKYDLPLIQYWRIEKGKANITIKTLTHLLSIHQITIDDFFCLLGKSS